MTEIACRGADWSELGKRDGDLGIHSQADQYGYQCGRFNVKMDEPAYLAAWRDAYATWSARSNPGQGDM